MKKLIVNVVAGTGLFAGSLAGMLAATGRLNHEGTKGIPLIGSFFPAPPENHDNQPAGGDASKGLGATAVGAEKPEVGEQGPEQPPDLRRGRSLFDKEPVADDGHGGAPAEAEGTAGSTGHSKPAPAAKGTGIDGHEQQQKDFQGLSEGLAADRRSPYSPGNFFRFDGMPVGMTADKLNEAWQRVTEQLGELSKRGAALDQRDGEILVLEQDVARRQSDLGLERTRIETMQKDVEARIEKFYEQVKMVRLDEVAGLKRNAATLATFEPSKAAELIQEQWRSDLGQEMVLKTLEVMDKDAANSIMAALPNGLIRDVLERRLRVVREQAAGTGK